MPGNDFEKQVQQKMDELHFAPSDAVWQAVEKQIRPEKRRRLFLWLPLLFLLTGGAVWVYINGTGANIKAGQVAGKETVPHATVTNNARGNTALQKHIKQIPLISDSITKHPAAEKNIPVAGENNSKDNIAVIKNRPQKNIMPEENNIPGIQTEYGKNRHRKNPSVIKTALPAGSVPDKTPAFKDSRKKNSDKTPPQKSMATGEGIAVAKIASTEENKTGGETVPVDTKTATIPAADSGSLTAKTSTNDSLKNTKRPDDGKAIAKNSTAGKTKKLEWGISMNAGMSTISQGFQGLFSTTPSYDPTAFSSIQNSTAGSINMSGANAAKPSDIRPGFAGAAGIFISKPLGNNYRLLAGLGYSYYSTHMEVGAKMNSNVGQAQYQAGSTTSYTNQFHFIELPVTMEKQLGSKSRFSVNGGLAFSLLAGSNALLYDAQKNMYYTDNSHINKLQAGLVAGAGYRLFQKSFYIEAGPAFNYNFSNLFKKELYGSRHLFFAGINAKIFFPGNKR